MRTVSLCLALLLATLGCPAFGQDEKAALSRFEKQFKVVRAEAEASEAAIKGNPMLGFSVVRKMARGITAVDTKGLPQDFKTVFEEYSAVFAKIDKALEGWPDDVDALKRFIEKKAATDPAGLQKTIAEVDAHFARLKPIENRADAVARKYGITVMSESTPAVK
jgi:hypothetical protein